MKFSVFARRFWFRWLHAAFFFYFTDQLIQLFSVLVDPFFFDCLFRMLRTNLRNSLLRHVNVNQMLVLMLLKVVKGKSISGFLFILVFQVVDNGKPYFLLFLAKFLEILEVCNVHLVKEKLRAFQCLYANVHFLLFPCTVVLRGHICELFWWTLSIYIASPMLSIRQCFSFHDYGQVTV